jgi:hypothetical protein
MFGARNAPAQAMLSKFGYLEGIQTNAHRIRKKAEIPRRIRGEAGFKDPLVNPALVAQQPGVFADLTDEIKSILIANPIEEISRLRTIPPDGRKSRSTRQCAQDHRGKQNPGLAPQHRR